MTESEECAVAWLALESRSAHEKDFTYTQTKLAWNCSECIFGPSKFFKSADFINARHTMTQQTRGVNVMSRQKTLDLLSTKKTLWNRWRRENAELQAFEPDLHEADLTEANLQGADLQKADLRETDLRHAHLQNANLSDANLLKARLHGADLRGAILCRTNLKGADLSNTDLRGADLDGAILDKANFKEANVSSRDLGEADPNKPLTAKERRAENDVLQKVKAA